MVDLENITPPIQPQMIADVVCGSELQIQALLQLSPQKLTLGISEGLAVWVTEYRVVFSGEEVLQVLAKGGVVLPRKSEVAFFQPVSREIRGRAVDHRKDFRGQIGSPEQIASVPRVPL